MAILSADQIYAVARQAGFSPDQAVTMTAIALAESGGNTQALNPNGEHSVGLWQINMRAHGSKYGGESALYSATVNAQAAWEVSGGGSNIRPWTVTHTSKGARYTRFMSQARQASLNAGESGQGNFAGVSGYYDNGYTGAGNSGGPTWSGGTVSGDAVQSQGQGPVELPPDAKVYAIGDAKWVMFTFRGQSIAWEVGDTPLANAPAEIPMTAEEWAARNVLDAGNVSELGNLELQDGQTMEAYLQAQLDLAFPDPNAWQDPSVVAVALQFIARPDMSDAELEALMRNTTWWQTHTDGQRRWNDMSAAEQQLQVDNTVNQVLDIWFRETGETLSRSDARVVQWASDIASGVSTLGAFTLDARDAALQNPESPWARRVRTEEEQQRQRGIDIEDQQAFVRRVGKAWGVQLSEDAVAAWGQAMVENISSEDDLVEYLKDQAAILYPWKDRELETEKAVEPWLQTHRRVMESEADMFNPRIQEALQTGMPVFEFERMLKDTDEWMTTKNGRSELEEHLSTASRLMGFS